MALHQVPPLSYLPALGALHLEWALAGAEIRLPLYVCVGGKDQIVDTAATKRIYERVATAKSQKTWRRWDEAFHTLCWDPVTPELVADLAKWALRAGAKECKDPGSEIGRKLGRQSVAAFLPSFFRTSRLAVAASPDRPADPRRGQMQLPRIDV